MKVTLSEILVSTLTLLTLWGFCGGLVYYGVRPLSSAVLAEYHIVLDLLAFFTLYGVLSALLLRASLALRPFVTGPDATPQEQLSYFKFLWIFEYFGQKALKPLTIHNTKPWVLGLFGARIGRNVTISDSVGVDCPYLIRIGDNCLLGQDAFISGNIHSGGDSRFGLVVIEANATIGARCMVFPNVRIGKGATLMVGSVVPEGTVIPEGETWRGNPARKWLGNPHNPAG